LFFGVLMGIFPRDNHTFELNPGATVADLLKECRKLSDPHRTASTNDGLWSSLAVAVNRQYAKLNERLDEGDEVALLPPVSGGTGMSTRDRVELVRERIATEAIVAGLKQGEDGAVVVFDGIVRNNTKGRRTLYLDYEAYEPMALEQMRDLAARTRAEFAVRQIALLHRLGKLEIGETSVLIAVASAHRGAAFDACRSLIDTLKKTVPIWKKEYFEDGAVWSDGEPFPDALRAGEID
jgi:molybdopterin synthase catalytic subunit